MISDAAVIQRHGRVRLRALAEAAFQPEGLAEFVHGAAHPPRAGTAHAAVERRLLRRCCVRGSKGVENDQL
jgi:hypothetical protein